jgi:hypothetical protein
MRFGRSRGESERGNLDWTLEFCSVGWILDRVDIYRPLMFMSVWSDVREGIPIYAWRNLAFGLDTLARGKQSKAVSAGNGILGVGYLHCIFVPFIKYWFSSVTGFYFTTRQSLKEG